MFLTKTISLYKARYMFSVELLSVNIQEEKKEYKREKRDNGNSQKKHGKNIFTYFGLEKFREKY